MLARLWTSLVDALATWFAPKAEASVGVTIHYFHTDHLGSSNVITDSTGTAVEVSEYTPYGSFSPASPGPRVTSHGFTGQRLDSSTGLYFYNARYYDPQLGRFTQPDSIVQDYADPQTLNRYSYARNNPLIYVDPSGHFFWFIFAAIAAIVHAAAAAITAAATYVVANAAAIATGALVGGVVGGASSAAMGGSFWQGALTGAIGGAIFAGLAPGLNMLGNSLARGVTLGGAAGPLTAGATMASNFGSAFLAGAASGAAVAGITGADVGEGALIGGATAGAFSVIGDTAQILRANMLEQSARGPLNGGNGKSAGFFGDGKKLGGGRHNPYKPNAGPSPLGGYQGQQGKLFGHDYSAGSIPDFILEMYAGPHDFLNSWAYDPATGYIRNLNAGEQFIGTFTNPLNVVLATPIAVPSAIPPIAYSAPGIIYGESHRNASQ